MDTRLTRFVLDTWLVLETRLLFETRLVLEVLWQVLFEFYASFPDHRKVNEQPTYIMYYLLWTLKFFYLGHVKNLYTIQYNTVFAGLTTLP